jgi:hypothetical protein
LRAALYSWRLAIYVSHAHGSERSVAPASYGATRETQQISVFLKLALEMPGRLDGKDPLHRFDLPSRVALLEQGNHSFKVMGAIGKVDLGMLIGQDPIDQSAVAEIEDDLVQRTGLRVRVPESRPGPYQRVG